ncbi:MAG: DMT family transporter [Syntrophotaleaceae bacterium]
MAHWYLLALTALVVLGLQRFLYKVSAEMRCNSAVTTFAFMATVALLSWGVYLSRGPAVPQFGPLLVISLVNSLGFLTSTLATIEALKNLSAGSVYPLTRLSTVLSVLFSLAYFGDRLSLRQGLGVLLALGVIVLLARSRGSAGIATPGHARRGFLLALLAIAGGAASTVSSKFAAVQVDSFGFMAVSYSMSTLLVLGVKNRMFPSESGQRTRPALLIGLVMGVTNFFGYYALLQALASGPLAIIAPLVGMYFIMAVLLSFLIYHERISRQQLLAILLTIFSILLMKT